MLTLKKLFLDKTTSPMPTLYPFTPAGVQSKINALYALSDTDLKTQADLIKADLRLWMNNNFSLTTAQQAYLNALDDRAVIYIGDQCSFNVENRLTILMVQEGTSSSGQFKWVHTENTNKVAANDNGDFIASGTLIIKIVYE